MDRSEVNISDNFLKLNDNQIINVKNDDDVDIINYIRSGILFGLFQIPDVGVFLSFIVGLLWPVSEKDVWELIRVKVEQIVQNKIDDAIFTIVKGILTGVGNNLQEFLHLIKLGDSEQMSQSFITCHNIFINELPQFQLKVDDNTKQQLLPLFVQFATVHLILLRTGIQNADKMKWSESVVKFYIGTITKTIGDYNDYVNKTYQDIENKVLEKLKTFDDINHVAKAYFLNECQRNYQITVLDFSYLFEYYDPVKYPGNVKVDISRVVYMGPIGSMYKTGQDACLIDPGRWKTMLPPTSFSLYSGGEYLSDDEGYKGGVVGYTIRHPVKGGPWGGQDSGDGRYLPGDGNIWIDCQTNHGPVTSVEAWQHNPYPNPAISTEFIYSLRFSHKDGHQLPVAGGCNNTRHPNTTFSIQKHILVDMYMHSYDDGAGAVGCIVLGFQLENMGHDITEESKNRALYIHSIKDMDIKDPKLEEDRNAFWTSCKKAFLSKLC